MPGARHISSLDCQQELLLMEGQHPLRVQRVQHLHHVNDKDNI